MNSQDSLRFVLWLGLILCTAGEPLFLTPYIEAGLIEEAKGLSLVQDLPAGNIRSYSGFFTVNATDNTNMFFWFFQAQKSPETAPVILWCEGGPGVSGMFSLFNENGPYQVDENKTLSLRDITWQSENNILFMDNPIGSGFSFTVSEDGYLKSSANPQHMYSLILQFFTLFPEYRGNEFFVSGVSFGGIYAPALAHEIHTRNQNGVNPRINLKGLLVESPWSDPVRQVNYGEFLYHIGLIDGTDRMYINQQMDQLRTNLLLERWAEANEIWTSVIVSPDSYFFNRTDLEFDALYNYIGHGPNAVDTSGYYVDFIDQDFVRNAIHVGAINFTHIDPTARTRYEDKGLKSVKSLIEALLNAAEDYRVMFYAGQLDVITYHMGIRSMIDGLSWAGAEEFRSTRAKPWRADGVNVSGFVTNARNLTYLLMRRAGHDANVDQPEWGLDVVTRFTKNLPFVD